MKKGLALLCVAAMLFAIPSTAYAADDVFGMTVEYPGLESTQADWNMATAIVQAVQRPQIPTDYEVSVKDFGAAGDGETNDLPAILQAIDETSERGGGKVIVPAGTFFCKGPVVLKSGVNLHLEEGSTILFSTEPADFLPVVKTRFEGTDLMNYSPLVYAYGQHDIAITGTGLIDGNADSEFIGWASKDFEHVDERSEDMQQLRTFGAEGTPLEERVFGEGHYLRPTMIEVDYCDRVLLEGYTVRNAPFWINHVNCSNHVQVRGLTVESMNSNNDGVDVESSTFVIVEECKFRTGDDSVVIKSGRDYDGRQVGLPSKYIVVRKNDMGGEDGMALGSEMSGGIAYVFVEDNIMQDGVSCFRFKSNLDRGATCEHVRIRNMKIQNFENFIWFQMNYGGGLGGNFPTVYQDLVFEDITVESISGNIFDAHAPKGYPAQNITLKDITIKQSEKTDLTLENVMNLMIDDLVINDQRISGVLSSY